MKRVFFIVLAALMLLVGCVPKTNDEGTYEGSLENAEDIAFQSETALANFLKDDAKTAAFEKQDVPVYGYYYRLKETPFSCSRIEIGYTQDTVRIEYYTNDKDFLKKNGDTYFAALDWHRNNGEAQEDLQDAIANGEPPVLGQKAVSGKPVYYGETEYTADTENNLPASAASAYYFIQDGFFFALNINAPHSEKNFDYCTLEKVEVK